MSTENGLHGSATYSPEDNKLRMSFSTRLPKDVYERVRSAGFIWAPKQEIFVAPMWTPDREDFAVEMCGEIGDEDTSLVERAEARAERFEDYSASRAQDADAAHKTVEGICEHIPLGQPILVGHHSERRARKDAERIENGMRKAVKMWEQSKYWTERAASAVRHAKYLERPDVRARRIKKIEAEKRKQERNRADAEQGLRFWRSEMVLVNRATGEKHKLVISEDNRAKIHELLGGGIGSTCGNFNVVRKEDGAHWEGWDAWHVTEPDETRYKACPSCTIEQCRLAAEQSFTRQIAHYNRWIGHYENRLAYERAMLSADGGLVAQRNPIAIGGRVLRRGSWYVVLKVNMRDGVLNSVTVPGHFASTISADEIKDYKPPQEGDFEKVKAFSKLPPLCNYHGERFATMTQAQWDKTPNDYRIQNGRRGVIVGTDKFGSHRVRHILGVYATLPPPAGKELDPSYCSANRTHHYWPVFITDAKVKMPPPPDIKKQLKPEDFTKQPDNICPDGPTCPDPVCIAERAKIGITSESVEAMKATLKSGVQVVSAPQLFPTPPELAQRMAETAELFAGEKVLEPSAGTGNLLQAIIAQGIFKSDCVAVEINPALAALLANDPKTSWPGYRTATDLKVSGFEVVCGDFLAQNGNLGKFDKIIMNPPFADGADIKHILHARTFLAPGGRIVAICANGPRQQEALKPLASSWEALPAWTFKESGTMVNAALLTIEG